VAIVGFDFAGSTFFGMSMVMFHGSLIMRNLTTNETINWRKYPHMKRPVGTNKIAFFNAFDGGLLRNIGWRTGLVPFDDDPVRLPSDAPGYAKGCCAHDHDQHHSHSHSHAHSHGELEAGERDPMLHGHS